MVFSRTAEYALRALTFLALQPPGRRAGAREISAAEGIPMPFLWKILQTLSRRKLVRSFKGVGGGYELVRPAERIRLCTVVSATDGNGFRDRCVLGLSVCSDRNPCPLHRQWAGIRTRMTAMLDRTSLADLAASAKRRRKQ
jgi:Rrf2 family protein